MPHLNTVLATTDLSAPARHAAQRAALLANQTGARLELLHVLEKTALEALQATFFDQDAAVAERVRELAREALDQLATDIGEPLGITAGLHL
ncbi:MAG: universal stress protein, partial [Rhodocyclaceae bacterium]|nr:universal stress protein [Rhodocyclaceae bacterium]